MCEADQPCIIACSTPRSAEVSRFVKPLHSATGASQRASASTSERPSVGAMSSGTRTTVAVVLTFFAYFARRGDRRSKF